MEEFNDKNYRRVEKGLHIRMRWLVVFDDLKPHVSVLLISFKILAYSILISNPTGENMFNNNSLVMLDFNAIVCTSISNIICYMLHNITLNYGTIHVYIKILFLYSNGFRFGFGSEQNGFRVFGSGSKR